MRKLQNDFTTPEQSKRLLELGVPADSADCIYYGKGLSPSTLIGYNGNQFLYSEMKESEDYLPCWSVGRLMEIYDICHVFSDHNDWCNTQCVNEYVAYIIDCYGRATDNKQLDFSKLEE